jgi:hypothetical protein
MNTTDWFVFIQQEHYFAPKCFVGPIMAFKFSQTPLKPRMNSGVPEGLEVTALLVTLVVVEQ